MKWLHQIPFFRLLLFFIVGIVVHFHWDVPVFLNLSFLFTAILCFTLAFLPKISRQYDFRFLFGMGLALLLFASAVFLTQSAWKQSEWDSSTGNRFYRAVVIDEPVAKPKTRMCKVRLLASGKKAVIYIPSDSLSQTIVAGDRLSFYGQLESAPPYLRKQSLAAIGLIRKDNWQLEENTGNGFSIRIQALSVRRMLLDRLHTIVPDRQSYAVAAALMFGYRNELDDTLMQSFRNIGAAHILAISGTHFAILFGMLYFLLSFIGNSRKGRFVKQLILLPFVWGFAFLTGFSPSVVRAALMLTVWGVGEAFAYRSFSLNTVAVAAFFMLLFHPLYLYDVGFQLSFLAVIAILLINPHLIKLYESKNPGLQYGWGLCCVSVSAQVGVLPLSVYYFHQVPVFFLLTNSFLLPLAAALLFLIPVSLLLHTLFGTVAWLLFPVNQSLGWFISVTKALDRFSYHNIHDVHLSLWDTAVWFLAIVFLALLLVKKRAIYFFLFIILLLIQGLYYW